MEATSSQRVRRYFDGQAARFDAVYQQDKPLGQRLVDGLFRRVIHHRFALTLDLCGQVGGKRVLDVGCGSGRYAVELARRGARVVGVDFAPAMIDMARQAAQRAGVEASCLFQAVDFLAWGDGGHFDICLAIGFFDYIQDPRPFLEKIRSLGPGQAVFSFPVRWTLRTPTRWLRLKLRGCPVYFYGAQGVVQTLAAAGWKSLVVHRLSRDYLVHAWSG